VYGRNAAVVPQGRACPRPCRTCARGARSDRSTLGPTAVDHDLDEIAVLDLADRTADAGTTPSRGEVRTAVLNPGRERKGLKQFRPHCYLTDEWGCPSEEPIIGIPFYLADPKLARLEKEIDDLEDEREIRMVEVKWEEGTRAYRGSRTRVPDDLPPEVVKTIQTVAVTGFQALHLRDYARFDFRITPEDKAYLIEANPNPYLLSSGEFIKAARASGRTYAETILKIVELSLARYVPRG
jgi:hypothetical protein